MGEYFSEKIGLEKTKVECEMCDNSPPLCQERDGKADLTKGTIAESKDQVCICDQGVHNQDIACVMDAMKCVHFMT